VVPTARGGVEPDEELLPLPAADLLPLEGLEVYPCPLGMATDKTLITR
jgi:hypothetical protein